MNLLRFDSVQCERTRGQMDAYLSNELLVETTSEVLKHLESCADCSHELESRSRVREALRKAAATLVPPDKLKHTIYRGLRNAQPARVWGFPRTTWAVALAAMALVILAADTTHQWRSLQRGKQLVSSILALGVADHLECAIKGHNYPEVAHPPEQLREKLGSQYSGVLQVVEEKLPGFQVLEAHICAVQGSPRKYVHFIARGRGTILSVILTRRDGDSFPAGYLIKAGAPDGIDLYQAQLEGMHAAGFESNEYFSFVVSDLGQDAVMQLTTAIAPPLRKALDGGVRAAEIETPPVI